MAQAAHEPEEPPTGGSEAPRAPQWLLEPGRTCRGAVAPASAALGSCPPSSLLVPSGGPHAEGETPVFILARLGRQRPASFRALRRPRLKAWLKEARAAPGRRLPLPGSGPWSSGGCRKNPLAPLRQERQGTDSCWALPRARCAGWAHPPLLARWTRAGGQRFI